MKLTFDYYHNLEKVELRLCNPDGRELFPLPGKNRNLALRFNDLSELTFEVDSKITLSDNTVVDFEAYDYIQTKRLVYATNIGWFQISGVDEHDNGIVKYKTIKAESYQSVLKNKGFISEERVYCFYNPNDPHDDRYNSTKEDSIPSVLGQWSKQLGIKQALSQGLDEPDTAYDDWTVTYVTPSLIYSGAGSICRTFKENTTFGYDWIVNDVEEAFGVVILFDFMYKTISVMTPSEVTQKVNVIYTFRNFMKSVDINENADDIVTVLNCNGSNCDITAVNPTGTNYICDFSYFMDKVHHRWMSAALIEKLEQWKKDCDAEQKTYTGYISQLRSLYLQSTKCTTALQEMSLSLQDLKNAQNKRSVVGNGQAGQRCGIIIAENVKSGSTSLFYDATKDKFVGAQSAYFSTAFTGKEIITAYASAPDYDANSKKWVFSGVSKSGTADSIIAENMSDDNASGVSYWYFSDVSDNSSYCKLRSAVTVNKDSVTSTYYCDGFDRYIAYTYPIVTEGTSITTYTDSVQNWIDLRERHVNSLNATKDNIQREIDAVSAQLDAIANRLNILSYFANTPALLRELNCYWIEGDYTNDNIAVLDSTTPEEEIDLSNELLDAGYVELSKMCQPRFSFSLESRDATKQYEFKDQMRLLELGKIITIEKEEGIWYYPALLEISLNLDNSDDFSMAFANAMRLDDWGYTYADLISDASSTSRQVSANWQDMLAYSKEREEISSIIKDPLNATLRASFANMVNQEFTVDNNGLLGRKKVSETSDEFEDEQIRLINNLLIFTDNNWETAKTALGKIRYTDDSGKQVSSYGLIADTIIGSLIMGEKLQIHNKCKTIALDGDGIAIKTKIVNENGDEDEVTVFKASSDGTLTLRNYATVDEMSSAISTAVTTEMGKIDLSVYATTDALTNGLNNIQVGARNLLPKTKLGDNLVDITNNSLSGFGYMCPAKTTEVTVFGITSDLNLKPNTYYTVSFTAWLDTTDTTARQKLTWDLWPDTLPQEFLEVTSVPTKYSWTISSPLDEMLDAVFRIFVYEADNEGYFSKHAIYITDIKLEAGNKATDWTPAPEDMVTNEEVETKIAAAIEGIDFSVKLKNYATQEYVDGSLALKIVDAPDGSRYSQLATDVDKIIFNSGEVEIHSNNFTLTPEGSLQTGSIGTFTRIEDGEVMNASLSWNMMNERNGYDIAKLTAGTLQFARTSTDRADGNTGTSYATLCWNPTKYETPNGGDTYRCVWEINSPFIDIDCETGRLIGDWQELTGASILSWRGSKNSIEDLPNKYSVLFDNLRPVRHKYNNASSNRYHTGLILDELKDAMDKAGIDSSELAAYCIYNENTGEGGIRYSELVALNIYEIQKLKTRVAELEAIALH